ncbi:MAG TPA: hypothetical protein VHE61_13225 [Opitutaceae bacterium]|nr:hypothetical protein [Opitutaceae bacterium]
MNKTNRLLPLLGSCIVLGIATPRALAVFGVADTTVIAGDLTDTWKWPRELEQWTVLIQRTTDQINKTDALIRIAGDPEALAHELIQSVPGLMEPLDNAIGLETRQQALNLSRALYGLGKAASKTYDDANLVDDKFRAFGETFERDPQRYLRYAMHEGLYARYQKAVSNQQAVDKKEAEVQREALEKLRTARTQTEIELCNAKLAASKQRQDMAHQIATQAQGEMEAFEGRLVVEDAKKAEADREWAQGVITRMREKALAAYRAQTGDGTTTE